VTGRGSSDGDPPRRRSSARHAAFGSHGAHTRNNGVTAREANLLAAPQTDHSAVVSSADTTVFTSARAFGEYVDMFGLSAVDFRLRILDCAAGAASFAAEAATIGARVTAVDPVYGRDSHHIDQSVFSGVERAAANVVSEPRRYDWSRIGDPASHIAIRRAAARRFLRDLRDHPDRYVAGVLPELPFAIASFDIVLCSHLLFTYAGVLDESFHVAAMQEMLRVAKREVRVFPLVGYYGDAAGQLARVVNALKSDGFDVGIQPVPYRFQLGATEMLRVAHR
jgi:SAM-dependent methyltransferase